MLHNIFEFVNFTENVDAKWENVIDISLQQFLPKYRGEFNNELLEMINNVVKANIIFEDLSFFLSQVDYEHRKSEIEFDINVKRFKVDQLMELQSLMPEGFEINAKTNEDIEGVLNGFVDLFFEYNGKYYVLDWKSNFLGDTMEDYTEGKLIEAMNESNYHLQYLIYTMAMKKYLSMKIPNFDYEKQFGGAIYVFLRGVREDQPNGIFTHKPSIELIKNLEAIFNTKEQ
jgi:exodeoxyribonuclease V beta subunit